MSYVDFLTPAINYANQGAKFDQEKNYEKAKEYYLKAIENFIVAIKHETLPQKKNMMKSKTKELIERTEEIKKYLDGNEKESSETNSSGNLSTKEKKADTKKSKEEDELSSNLDSTIMATKPDVKWDDVAGLEEAKEALKDAVIFPIIYPQFFQVIDPWNGILLYGPPGTGKSYLAKAIANEANCTFFNVSAANLISKWQGETEKLIATLFKKAREMKPSIIFIDEIDSICSARGDNDTDATRRGKTQILIEMDGVGKSGKGVLVLGATNVPWNLDEAFIRRFQKRVYIGLPDIKARIRMLEIHIGKSRCQISKENFQLLAQKTEGFSGSDIKGLVTNALYEPLRKCKTATHFKIVEGPNPMKPDSGEIIQGLYTPCSPGDPYGSEISMKDIPPEKLLPSPVTFNDFLKSLSTSSASVDPTNLGKYKDFTEKVGIDGS